jgi:hypothetical protein
MSLPLPLGATCGAHPDVPATWVCERCGTFVCGACERRVRPDAKPMCPACWEMRARKVPAAEATSSTRLQTAGMVIGLISILPIPVLQIASLVLNIIAIVRAKEGAARAARWRPIVGLCGTGVGLLFWIVIIVLVASGSTS